MPKKGEKENLDNNKEIKGISNNLDIVEDLTEKKKKKAPAKKRRKKTKSVPEMHPLEQFGLFRQNFIIEHIRTIDYVDMANLLVIKTDELKAAVEKMGIKLPIERAHKWDDIDVGSFISLTHCARCQVQCNHGSFFVGINDCRKCYEKNIKHWVELKVPIILHFPGE